MRNTGLGITVLVIIMLFGCGTDDAPTADAVRIRIANTGTVALNTVIVDNLTFVDIAPDQQSEYQIFSSEIGLPPSFFSIKTPIGERAVVYDYVQGATLAYGNYTYKIRMTDDGDLVIEFPQD